MPGRRTQLSATRQFAEPSIGRLIDVRRSTVAVDALELRLVSMIQRFQAFTATSRNPAR